MPRPLLYAGILVFACLGVYSLSGSGYEVLMALLIGVVGFFMRKLDFPGPADLRRSRLMGE